MHCQTETEPQPEQDTVSPDAEFQLPSLEEVEQIYAPCSSEQDLITVNYIKYLESLADLPPEDHENIIQVASAVDQLARSENENTEEYSYDKPYMFKDLDKGTEALDFNEVGYGENLDKIPLSKEEQSELTAIILEQLSKVDCIESDDLKALELILLDNIAAFGTKDSPARMSKLTPIKCTLKDESVEILAQPRWLGKEQMEFLRKRLLSMLKRGLIRPTSNPLYGSQAFLVLKKGLEKYRLVVDMRRLNENTRKTSLMMPNLEQQLNFPVDCNFFGSFDILSGFDYLPVEEDSRKYFVIVTCFGSFEFCGSPQGWVNTPQFFQNRMLSEILQPAELFAVSDGGILQWIDDSLLYASSFSKYCQTLDKFLKQLIKKNLRLNVNKCTFISQEGEWCGRRLERNHWSFSKRYFDKILLTPKPTFTHELAKALYLINWLSPTIPKLAELRDIFSPLIEPGITSKELKKRNEVVPWEETLDTAWIKLLEALNAAANNKLRAYDPNKPLCLFTDASNLYWGLMLTLCLEGDPANTEDKTPVAEQQHVPIFFLSGKFTASQVNWHISQKELYPIIYAFKRLPYFIYGHPGRLVIFTDHKNLVYILHPDWSPKSAYIDRLTRWGLLLQNRDIIVRHIAGDDNVAADILSRWGNSQFQLEPSLPALRYNVAAGRFARGSFSDEEISFLNPWYQGKWSRVTEDEILSFQREALESETLETIFRKKGKIWIPSGLISRIVVHNHIAQQHPSLQAELNYLKAFAFELSKGETIKDIVLEYRQRCLHCHRRPKVLRRQLNLTPLTNIPRKIIHADYLYLNKHSHLLV